MECPLCKSKMVAETVLTGGCGGHWGEDDRCYCDNADVHIEFRCPNDQSQTLEQKGKKWRYVKNPNYCKQPRLKVGELSDYGSIGRWLTENYVPGVDSKIF